MDFEEAYQTFSKYWESPFRFYHTKENHLDVMLGNCNSPEHSNKIEFKYFALFHDIVYDPYSNTNEEDSAIAFKNHMHLFDDLTMEQKKVVVDMILATKDHIRGANTYVNDALGLDLVILESSFEKLLQYENLIFKEFQKHNIKDYIEGRVKFLSNYAFKSNISNLIKYIKNKRYKIGIYAGSFDPFHVGHLDILRKAEKLFDKVVIVRAQNPSKAKHEHPMPQLLPNQIINHDGLITDLFKPEWEDPHSYTLIRGIRNEYDIASEMNYMAWIKEINKNIQFVHIFCDQENIKVSSSALKNLSKVSGFNCEKWIVK